MRKFAWVFPATAVLGVALVAHRVESDVTAAAKPNDYMARPPAGARPSSPPPGPVAASAIENVPVCTAAANQLGPVIVSLGSSGIVLWEDNRYGQLDIYAQQLAPNELPEWVEDGVPVCKAAGNQSHARGVSDGMGGVIVAWEDARGDTASDIYAQRLTSEGIPAWANGGVLVCGAWGNQRAPLVAEDGQGGAVVAWVDDRAQGSDVYVQRVSASGVVQWNPQGVALCTAAGVQQQLAMATDGQRGAIVAWQDGRADGGDIYAQRVTAGGVAQWSANGVALCAAAGVQEAPEAVCNGAAGLVVAWEDGRTGERDVYAQRVDGAGAPQWAANGVAACAAQGEQRAPVVCEDGQGGVVMAWQDGRPGGLGLDVYAQRLNGAGAPQWATDGVGVCTAAWDQVGPALVLDPVGGVLVAWSDARSGGGTDIYAQHLADTGAGQWTAQGVLVCDAAHAQEAVQVMPDGLGGGQVVWLDHRAGLTTDLYGQHLDPAGQVSNPCPAPGSLVSGVPDPTTAAQNYRTFRQQAFYWSGVGVQGTGGADWDIEVYDQTAQGMSPYPVCFGEPLAGSFGATTTDFVVGDFNDNHTPPAIYAVRASLYSGSGSAVIEWDDGSDMIVKDGPGVTSPSNWTGPLDVYDVSLTAGSTYWFELVHDPAADVRVLVFTAFGALDYYYVVPRSARAAESMGHWMSYTAPATDRYGVVVVNDNGTPGQYTLKVWSAPPVGVAEGPLADATGLQRLAPNPTMGPWSIQFTLREAGMVAFDVLDLAGRVVARIPERRWEAGKWTVAAEGGAENPAAPGLYFVRMSVDGHRVGPGRPLVVR
jgi:hypothetical protein